MTTKRHLTTVTTTITTNHQALDTRAASAPWVELPDDAAHPTFDDAPRFLIGRHTIQLHHDVHDEYEDVTVTATHVLNGLTGEQIELGPWSLTASDARELANSLHHLAATIDAVGA
ncbi:hypothetical protein ERC79_02620 [Rhodococcus sp. ABRD24]|uniref:hypothetical protein n=1 Tax=Rhodococcus sp. ABRD24 TaxID=2507582 RepID=UPI00103A46CD|nr:hypothetical protein [Rhodococcus sp. ABRD24]QBJ94980.1 hypothetical protein ERC79_02620 [Rhodococcus sp. ABRD24]